jgi:nickel superoxide dismutase
MKSYRTPTSLLIGLFCLAAILTLQPHTAGAHCQVPCGIYGDKLKFDQLAQHIETIDKSMRKVRELSANLGQNANQLIRWTINKDDHADLFAHEITYYFLQQRIKLDEADTNRQAYLRKIQLCHELLVYAMKTKQSTDQANVEMLRDKLTAFRDAYMDESKQTHLKDHHDGSGEAANSTESQSSQSDQADDAIRSRIREGAERAVKEAAKEAAKDKAKSLIGQ